MHKTEVKIHDEQLEKIVQGNIYAQMTRKIKNNWENGTKNQKYYI